MATQHIVRSYDEELNYLEKKIVAMGEHASLMIAQAVQSIIDNDATLAAEVVKKDVQLDEDERDIAEKAITIIAKRQPMAIDLREIIGTIRISADIERIGDMAKNIGKRAAPIAEIRLSSDLYDRLRTLTDLALSQMREVLDAYQKRSLQRIDAVREQDNRVDAQYTEVFRQLLALMIEDSRHIAPCTHLLFCAKNIERVGDHVTNIAETLHYMITGELMPPERPRNDLTYRVSSDDIATYSTVTAETLKIDPSADS